MPASTTVRKPSSEHLFRCHIPAKHLKAIVMSAKAMGDSVVLEMDSSDENTPMRFWSDDGDAKGSRTYAFVGTVSPSALMACDGDDLKRTVQASTKHLQDCLKAFNMKRPVEIRLSARQDMPGFLLILRQSTDDETEPDERTISVTPSDSRPHGTPAPKGAYAAVNLDHMNKVLSGQKKNTDILTVSIDSNCIEIAASTKRMQDAWKHAATTNGKGKGVYSPTLLKKAVSAALAIDEAGEIHLSGNHPLRITSANEDLEVKIYVAGRDVMK